MDKWVETSGEGATLTLVGERRNGEETQSFEYHRQ